MKFTPRQLTILATMGYATPLDFLNHFPIKYSQYRSSDPVSWQVGDTVIIHGSLETSFKLQRLGGKRSITRFSVFDGVHSIPVVAFNRSFLTSDLFKQGISVMGAVDKQGNVVAKTINAKSLEENLGIQVHYSLKAGIKNYEIVRMMGRLLEHEVIENYVPEHFIKAYHLVSRKTAMLDMHQPQTLEAPLRGARTLKYEEFLKYHLTLIANDAQQGLGIAFSVHEPDLAKTRHSLPYELSDDQATSLEEILNDMQGQKQMHRLLQGDVGSGKTIVAFLSALVAIRAGYQVCFMVPTEILMHQHVKSFKQLFPKIETVSVSFATEAKQALLNDIKTGQAQMIFGTHSLFSKSVEFAALGYVIIDEQHRFGVHQRQALMQKGNNPDLLMLSATPIPRTLANALYFNLDVSTIEHYPSSRQAVQTFVIAENSLRSIQPELEKRLAQGEQVYVVCPAVAHDARSGVRDVVTMTSQLKTVFSKYTVGMLHGQMKAREKEDIMALFVSNQIQVLVCTTVIEVGIDVHNATTIVIYNAEQFGLASLHQLRGRVGRGHGGGVCYLLSGSSDDDALNRLAALKSTFNGFELSMIDMRHRGMGDALGSRQSGLPNFILGDIENDAKILAQAKIDAQLIFSDASNPDYAPIMNLISAQDYLKIL